MKEEKTILPFESPVFPLNIVALPGETVPLHIFESRYKALVKHCLCENEPPARLLFGIMHHDDGVVSKIGCLVRITEIFHKYADGRLDMLTVGEDRFEILGEVYEDSYPRGQIRIFEDHSPEEVDSELVTEVESLYDQVIETFKLDPKPEPTPPKIPVSFTLAKYTVTRVENRLKLLRLQSENERLRLLRAIYEELIGTVAEREEMKRIVQLNGHFGIIDGLES